MRRFQLVKESLIATLLILLAVFIINHFPLKAELAKLFKQEMKDYDLYDLEYAGANIGKDTRDKDIVLIENGNTRSEIAEQLLLLDSLGPAVIGLDITFIGMTEDSLGNYYLPLVIPRIRKLVVATRITEHSTDEFTIQQSYFSDPGMGNREGYINLVGDQFTVARSFVPFVKIHDTVYPSFASRIVELYDKGAFQRLQKRRKKIEWIDYTGNLETYDHFSYDELNEYHESGQLADKIRDRIVLVGYFKKQGPLVLEDLHFTPLNERPNGKTHPDMYGVVVHANIISMILQKNYIKKVSRFGSYLLAGLFTFLLTLYMIYRYKKNPHPAHYKFILIQVGMIIVLVYLFLLLFSHFRVKVPLLPIIIALVLAVEMFGAYKSLARWLNRKWGYVTIFSRRKMI